MVPAGRRGGSWARPWFPCCNAEFQAVNLQKRQKNFTCKVSALLASTSVHCDIFQAKGCFQDPSSEFFLLPVGVVWLVAWTPTTTCPNTQLWGVHAHVLRLTNEQNMARNDVCRETRSKGKSHIPTSGWLNKNVQDEGQKGGRSLEMWNIEEPRGHNTIWEARCQKGEAN